MAVLLATELGDIPCSLQSKLPHDITLYTKEGVPVVVPKHSRFLRFSANSGPVTKGVMEGPHLVAAPKRRHDGSLVAGPSPLNWKWPLVCHGGSKAFWSKLAGLNTQRPGTVECLRSW